ncbi:MAG: hypothetical protein LBF83_07055, partial [Spirochaetaceae bacterium]|nr:hypothetical protein [Spirochaetaceae bacterium]
APGRTPGSLTADTDDDQDLTAALESLSNILVAAVLKKCGDDPKKQVDPDMWEAGFNALISLFCGSYSRNVVHYDDKVKGPGAIKEIMTIAFDVYGEPDGKLKDDITSYLQTQGALMEKMGYTGELNNPYTLIGFSSFVKDDKRRCAFTAYFTTFDVKTVKISRTCREPQKEFDFDFTITHCNADFMIASWETNPAFRQRVKDFIANHPPEDDYFNTLDTGAKFNEVPSK